VLSEFTFQTRQLFLAQKILIHDKRDRADKAKDILYIHDTIETFGGNLPTIRGGWETNVKPTLHARLNAQRRLTFRRLTTPSAKPRESPQAGTSLQRWFAKYAAMDGSRCFLDLRRFGSMPSITPHL
jgi:hypothetical protein